MHVKSKVTAFLILFITNILLLILGNPILLLISSLALLILIICKSKVSYFSELSFILWFSYLQGIFHKVVGVTGSTLAWAGVTMPFYFNELSIASVSFLLTMLWFVWFTGLISNEKRLYLYNNRITYQTAVLLQITSVILVILVFPSIPTFKMDIALRRTQGLSGLYGFLLIALILASLTIDQSFKHKKMNLIYLFIVVWVFGHAERVEVLGFLSYYAIKTLNYYDFGNVRRTIARAHKRKIFFGGVAVLLLAMWIGMTRMSDISHVNLGLILYNLLVQPTCGDVVYVFNCATDLWKNGNVVHGLTYIDYLLQLIPGSTSAYSPAVVIMKYYTTMGGGLFYTEPMMNFGILGVVFFNIEFCVVMNLILKKSNRYRTFFWIPIVIEVFRTCWYGRSGWILAAFIEVPLLYIIIFSILQKRKNCVQ
jgi:hypothetical protein